MDYSKLSDFQINMAVHGCLGLDLHDCTEVAGSLTKIRSTGGHCVDYCNNPVDAWPIIVEKKLSIYPSGERWGVEGFNADDPFYFDDNPLRAAMIVFLLLQESAYVQTNPARPDIR